MNEPLAERIRPKTLEEYISQSHLVGENGALTYQIKQGIIPSLILWGPPGTGKTTLANIIATESKRPFYMLSAINSGVKDIRDVINKAKQSGGLFTAKNPILFIDEIHRFSKSQQDSLLASEVIPALLSRCQVYILNPFEKKDLEVLLKRALNEDEFLKNKKVTLKETEALLRLSGGDGRKLLNILKVQKNTVLYDKTGEQHYDIISAFIKSIRGSDPNAAVYWLARMIEGGEDVKFIARRLVILASEDIGNANPTALVLANSTFDAVNTIGYPEARIILSQCVTYLASSPKSNASYMAINAAQQKVKETGDLSVLPDEISGTSFFKLGNNPRENVMKDFLKKRWKDKYDF